MTTLNTASAIKTWREGNPKVRLDLGGANLYGANLRNADLGGANLGANRILQIGPGGSRNDYLVLKAGPNLDEVITGCFRGTLAEFEAQIIQIHGDNTHGRYYQAVIDLFRQEAHHDAKVP